MRNIAIDLVFLLGLLRGAWRGVLLVAAFIQQVVMKVNGRFMEQMLQTCRHLRAVSEGRLQASVPQSCRLAAVQLCICVLFLQNDDSYIALRAGEDHLQAKGQSSTMSSYVFFSVIHS